MLRILNRLFRKASVVHTPTELPAPVVDVQPGMQFQINYRKDTNNDPFPPKQPRSVVTVRDVRDGWVRYRIGTSGMFDDERMELKSFVKIYEPII
jgi:hypothetical protein